MRRALLYIIFITTVGYLSYNTLMEINTPKVNERLNRLPCHKNIIAFERSYDTKSLNKAKELLLGGNYQIKSDIDKAQFMKSTLFNFISLKNTDQYFYKLIDEKTKKARAYQNGITVDYTIFENDLDDPKKKSPKSKLYRGYVVLKIKNSNNKVLYQVQIDFMDHKGKDIYKTLDCALESFLTY